MTYIPIHNHTCWSLLDSTVIISELAREAKKKNIPAVCLTDHANMKALVPFFREMKSSGIVPIAGCELNIFNDDFTDFFRVTVLSKNKKGLKNLVKLVSLGNSKNNIERLGGACITFNELSTNSKDLICLLGDGKSELFDSIYKNSEVALRASDEDNCRKIVSSDWSDRFDEVVNKYSSVFCDFFIYCDKSSVPAISLFEKCVNLKTSGRYLPSVNVHYLSSKDRDLHNLIRKSSDGSKGGNLLTSKLDDAIFSTEAPENYLMGDLDGGDRTLVLLDLIEDYDIQEKPILPNYNISNEKPIDAHEHMVGLCRKGFVGLGLSDKLKNDQETKKAYRDRIEYELGVFKDAGISSYFLIVKDLIDFTHNKGLPADVRGSSSGCLVSYLLGISSIDPMNPDPSMDYSKERELPFERFYNEGRNTDGNVSLADIDIDVPPDFRGPLIEYARYKYGDDNVGHIIAHSKFKAKGAIKEIFRLLKPVPNYFEVANEITQKMVDESKIADEIMEMQQEDSSYGILKWNIDNIESVKNYYDTYKDAFDLAMKLEQIPKNESVHAAGIIIANQTLSELFPMRFSSKLNQLIIDIEGVDVEYVGGVKFDILGVAALEKMYHIQKMLNNNLKQSEYGVNV